MHSVVGLPRGEAAYDVFERWSWLYALCREHLFTDHTELLARTMETRCASAPEPVFVELGCGPGFYSVAMAKRFPHWQVIGVDRSGRLLERARGRVACGKMTNCSFANGDATSASPCPCQADFLLASRLLLILPERRSALAGMYHSLKPGGTLLIAEPRPGWRSRLALFAMSVLDVTGRRCKADRPCSPLRALSSEELRGMVSLQDWKGVDCWCDARYNYALCQKG